MESEFEPNHDLPESEPVLEIVEGDAKVEEPERSIVPNAFESVLEKYDEPAKFVETEAPAYKNRAFIAAVCLIGGIFAGRLTIAPKIETRIIEKEKPVLVASQTPTPTATDVPNVDKAFRELTNLGEFDPWQPMNGGFPLPPKDTQAKIVARSSAVPTFSGPAPAGLSGRITPMDPSDFTGTLPNIGGPAGTAANFPNEPAGATKPNGTVTVDPNQAKLSGKERYVSISMNGPDPERGQSSISSIAASFGGSARSFTHMSEDATVDSRGVLVIVPAGKYEEALAKIEALGGASIDSSYEGLASDRQSQIQAMFVSRLAKLREKQKSLLVDFLDDAQPVKQINEAIDNETRAVSATRLPGGIGGMAVIRILLK